MRTDVKIGITVGLVLVVGVVAYMVLSPGSQDTPDGGQPVGLHTTPKPGAADSKGGGLDSGGPDGSLDSSLFGPKPVDPWAPGVGGGNTTAAGTGGTGTTGGAADTTAGGTTAGGTTAGGTTAGGTTTGDTTTGDIVVGIGVPATGGTTAGAVTDRDPGSVEITMVPSGPVDPGPAGTSWPPAGGDSSAGPVDPGTPRDVPYPDSTGGSTAGAVVGTGKTHVIKSGDSLWKLAEAYYGQGNGKHWQLLVAANPGLSPNTLVVGKTIKIPPLPVAAGSSVRAAVGPTGTITSAADGTKTYIVAKNDSFWKIAARSDVYGNGIHYKLIAAANPGANSSSLQPGDKLIIPPLKTTSPGGDVGTGTGTSRAVAPAPVTATGEKIYVVKSGDSGMWGISKNQYGDGKYFPAIANKNPGVNPSVLKPGRKLILPSLEQAKAFLGGSSRRTPVSSGIVGGTSTGGTSAPIPARRPTGGTSAPIPVRTPRTAPPPAAPAGGDGEPDFS